MISLTVEDTLMKSFKSTYRADFLFSHGIPGICYKPTAFNVTVTCPRNATAVPKASIEDLAAAEEADRRQDNRQKTDLDEIGYDFIPLPPSLSKPLVVTLEK